MGIIKCKLSSSSEQRFLPKGEKCGWDLGWCELWVNVFFYSNCSKHSKNSTETLQTYWKWPQKKYTNTIVVAESKINNVKGFSN